MASDQTETLQAFESRVWAPSCISKCTKATGKQEYLCLKSNHFHIITPCLRQRLAEPIRVGTRCKRRERVHNVVVRHRHNSATSLRLFQRSSDELNLSRYGSECCRRTFSAASNMQLMALKLSRSGYFPLKQLFCFRTVEMGSTNT